MSYRVTNGELTATRADISAAIHAADMLGRGAIVSKDGVPLYVSRGRFDWREAWERDDRRIGAGDVLSGAWVRA